MTEEDFKLLNGYALNKIAELSQSLCIDIKNPEALKAALSTCLVTLCEALDDDRIIFKKDLDEAMLYGLLTLAITQFFDGNVPLNGGTEH